jgi:hypothetical protein
MIELFIKLLEKISELSKLKSEQRAVFYRQFIEPMYEEFKNLHDRYLKNFRKYRNNIKNGVTTLGGLFDQVASDRLYEMNRKLSLVGKLSNLDEFPLLAEVLRRYFVWENFALDESTVPVGSDIGVIEYEEPLLVHCNPGGYLIKQLAIDHIDWILEKRMKRGTSVMRANDNEINEKTLLDIDCIVQEMQLRYLQVIKEFEALKNQMLK